MSGLSKIFLIASPLSFFLAFVIHLCELLDLERRIGGGSEEWESAMVHLYATGWDMWDDIMLFSKVAGFACVFCAILVWKRDSPHQKLFPE